MELISQILNFKEGNYIYLIIIVLLVWVDFLYRQRLNLEKQIAKEKRDNYIHFIEILFESAQVIKDKIVNMEKLSGEIGKFAKKLILFSSPKTLKAFNSFRYVAFENPSPQDPKIIFKPVCNLIKLMRKEIGLSNKGLRNYELLQPFIKEDLRKKKF